MFIDCIFSKEKDFCVCIYHWLLVFVAIANGVVLSDRKTPFTAVDLTLVKSVLPILSSYLEVWQILGIVILLVVGVGGLVCLLPLFSEDKRFEAFSQKFYIQQLQ